MANLKSKPTVGSQLISLVVILLAVTLTWSGMTYYKQTVAPAGAPDSTLHGDDVFDEPEMKPSVDQEAGNGS